MATSEYLLLLDGDCGICGSVGRWIRVADLRHRIRLETIQSSRELLRDVPEEQVFDAFHVVSPDGQLTTGGDAVPVLIEALPMGAGFGRMLRGSRDLMARVHALYRFLTRFRERLVCRVVPGGTSAGSGP